MTHPDPDCNKYQAEFLESCQPDKRRMYELMFKIGNATFRYHQLAKGNEITESIWNEWIEGLEEPVKSGMKSKGFEQCKTVLSFTRYVNERNDLGLDEYLKQNLDEKDLDEYNQLVN